MNKCDITPYSIIPNSTSYDITPTVLSKRTENKTTEKLAETMLPGTIKKTRETILNKGGPFQPFFEENPDLKKIFNHCDSYEYSTEEENSTEENNEGRNFTITIGNKKYHLLDVNFDEGYSSTTIFDGRCQIGITKDPRNGGLDPKLKSFIENKQQDKQKENKQRHMIREDEFKDLYEGLRNKIKGDLGNKYDLYNDEEKKLLLSYVTGLRGCYIITTNDEYYISRIPPLWGFGNYIEKEDEIIYGLVLLVYIEDINP